MAAEVWVTLVGVAMLVLVGWCWRGRSPRARAWARNPMAHAVVLGMAPGLGLILVGLGAPEVFEGLPVPDTLKAVVGSAGLVVAFAAMPLGFVFSLYHPRWWGPKWFHRMSLEEKTDIASAANAAGIGAMAGRGPGPSADRASRAFGSFARMIDRWQGGYVHDPDTDERAHGQARRGTVDGTVTLYDAGVTFAATKAEDMLRERETMLMLPAEQITGARVVPPRAGADGVARRGRWCRSWFSRLVVDTGEGSYVFELDWGNAKHAVEQITTITGRVA